MGSAASNPPTAYALLARANNAAADAALLLALPELRMPYLGFAIQALIERNRPAAISELIRQFETYPAPIRDTLLAHSAGLEPSLRWAIGQDDFHLRLGALAIISAAADPRLAYLLADALVRPCPATRERAAGCLLAMVERRPPDRAGPAADGRFRAAGSPDRYLSEALTRALRGWELHRRPEVLQAAARCIDLTASVIEDLLRQRRSTLRPALAGLLGRSPDPALAPFMWWALPVPELGRAAAECMGLCEHDGFMIALVDGSRAMRASALRQAASRIRRLTWLRRSLDPLLALSGRRASAAVRLVGALGITPAAKTHLLVRLAQSPNAVVARAALGQLLRLSDPAADLALRRIAARDDLAIARQVSRALARRPPAAPAASFPWADLRAGRGRERSEEDVYRMACHLDPMIRSAGVRALGRFHTPTAHRLLRQALYDPDSRVQANAVETADAMDLENCRRVLTEKLSSPSDRVRAGAIRALLRRGDEFTIAPLRAMLEDDGYNRRLSALWVVEREPGVNLDDRIRWLSRHDPDHEVRARARSVVGTLAARRRERRIRDIGTPSAAEIVP